MSTPENPLNNYRSYSYYHQLVACDSTDAVESLQQESTVLNSGSRDRKIIELQKLETYDYAVIIDGSRDADFVIQDLQLTNYLIQADGDIAKALSFETTGKIKIFEPLGIGLIDYLTRVQRQLKQPDIMSVPFILKTVFVGVKPDGQQDDHIINMKPIALFITGIAAVVDTIGTTYELEFFAISNGVGNLEEFNKINIDKISVSASSNLLKDTIDAIQVAINDICAQSDKKQIEDLKKIKPRAGNNPSANTYISTTVKLILDPAYENYVVESIPSTTHEGKQNSPMIFTASNNPSSIEFFLSNLFTQVPEMGNDTIPITNKNNSVLNAEALPRIEINKKQKKPVEEDGLIKIEQVVEVKITKTAIFKNYDDGIAEKNSTDAQIQNTDTKHKLDPVGNTITFDYFFSGLNTDILDFNINLPNFLLYYHDISASSYVTTDFESDTPTSTKSDDELQKELLQNIQTKTDITDIYSGKANDPLNTEFTTVKTSGPTTLTQPLTVKKPTADAPKKSTYIDRLQYFTAIDSLQTTIKITGNPLLFDNLNDNSDYKASDAGNVVSVAKYWKQLPVLARINVYLPEYGLTYDNNSFKQSNFFYNEWYHILQVDSSFSNGKFEQTLYLAAKLSNSLGDSVQ